MLLKKLSGLMHLRTSDKVEFVVDASGNVSVLPITSPITRLKGLVPPPKKAVSLADIEEVIAEGAGVSCGTN